MGAETSRLRRALRIIGPWPVRPAPVTGFLAVFMILWVGSSLASAGGLPLSGEDWVRLALAVPSAIVIGLVLWGMQHLLGPRVTRLPWYLVTIGVAAVTGAVFRLVTGQLPADSFPAPQGAAAYSAIRLFALMLVAQAIMGLVTERLEAQVSRANTALAESRRLQQRLIEADERMRTQVAVLLHDRVQAGLIAACLELTDAVSPASGSHPAAAVRDVVRRLEAIRDIDVRQAAHRLSPDLASLDLRTALEDLASQYLPGMRTSVELGPDFTLSVERAHLPALLAAYRLSEQSLLNAAIHGRARRCVIRVVVEENILLITITDDGVGPSTTGAPGLGTFVNDTWAGILGGSWSLTASSSGGAVVTARFPLTGPDHAEIDRALTGLAR